eukprot:03964_5
MKAAPARSTLERAQGPEHGLDNAIGLRFAYLCTPPAFIWYLRCLHELRVPVQPRPPLRRNGTGLCAQKSRDACGGRHDGCAGSVAQ